MRFDGAKHELAPPPFFAGEWIRRACERYNIPHAHLRLAWRIRQDGDTYSYGRTWTGVRGMLVVAGTSEVDQAIVFLHELSHAITSSGHTARFWSVAFDLYGFFGIDLSVAFERERHYKKQAAVAAARLGVESAKELVESRREHQERRRKNCLEWNTHSWSAVEGIPVQHVHQNGWSRYGGYRLEICRYCRSVAWKFRERLSLSSWLPNGVAVGKTPARWSVKDLEVTQDELMSLPLERVYPLPGVDSTRLAS